MITKLAIVDDQTLFREGIRMIFESDPKYQILIEAANGQDLLDQLETQQPDLVLLDYSMPIMDGYEAMKVIQKEYPQVLIVILSMHYDEDLIVFLMEKGANGFLLKDEPSSTVRHAIDLVMETGQYFPSYVSSALLKHLKGVKKMSKIQLNTQKEKGFSKRELEILQIIGKCSRKEMAERLFISIKTVDFHLKKLRDKTHSNSTGELVNYAIRNGYQE